MDKKKRSKISISTGIFVSLVYVVCVLWGSILTVPAQQMLHVELFEMAFPGFVWINFGSFIWGLLLSFAYGWVGARAYIAIYCFFCDTEKKEDSIDLGSDNKA